MLDQQVTLSAEALVQEIGGEAVILDLASSTYFGLDDIGLRIWRLLETGKALNEVLGIMLEEYDVSERQMETDLLAFVDKLHKAGLVSVQ